jgi:hypothetical protein
MATMEQLKAHISTTKTKLDEAQKKAGDAKYDPDVRKVQKKYKRLTRKVGKIVYMEKKKEEKGKKKKTSGGE